MDFLEGIQMTTPIQILELMDPKAASDLTNVVKLFEDMLDNFEPFAKENAEGTLLLFNN